MIHLASYNKRFEEFLLEGVRAVSEMEKRPTVVGLLFSPIYGDLYLHLHFDLIDPQRPPAFAEFDQLAFKEIHFPEWEDEYWNGSKSIKLQDGAVLDLREVCETYCRPFVEHFALQFDDYWNAPERRNAVDWLACEVLGCGPFHIWLPGKPPTEYYPKSIFIPGPPLLGK